MGLRGEPTGHPRVPDQQSDIAPGSPLAIVALFTEIVRERFRITNNLAWVFNDNATAGCDVEGTVGSPKKIVIEPAFNEDPEARNARPAIYIDKNETIGAKVVVNNFAGQHIPSGLQAFYALATIPIEIECVGAKGESATLGDLVWFYVLAGRQYIMSTFGIHDMTPPILAYDSPNHWIWVGRYVISSHEYRPILSRSVLPSGVGAGDGSAHPATTEAAAPSAVTPVHLRNSRRPKDIPISTHHPN